MLADLAAIWTFAIETDLGVPLSDLGQYRAVLVIPALYDRPVIKHLVSILLKGSVAVNRTESVDPNDQLNEIKSIRIQHKQIKV